jgi:starch synthase
MKIAIVAAEISPWAKVGGLADVIGALPPALAAAGGQPVLIMPGYRRLLSQVAAKPVAEGLALQLGAASESFALMLADGPGGIPLYLVVHPRFFDRDGIYGENGKEYPDNVARYIFFGRAAARVAAEFVRPGVVHAHDWHAASTSIVMRADPALARSLGDAVSVFTIHNLAFQGICERSDFDLLGIPASYFTMENLEFHGLVNLMKGATALADGASTVSPSYAREVTADSELGFGLEGVLRHKGARFIGILNGADYGEWNPATDATIAAHYEPGRPEGKRACALALCESVGLEPRAGVPLAGMVSRMTAQKGFDLLRVALDQVMALDLKLVMLANGDSRMESFFHDAERRYPDRLRVVLEFNNALAHRIMAGCDAFLMPSRFEPCGLTQMYALKYGTVPVVRATGGLRDTVAEFDPARSTGNGFVFEAYQPEDLIGALGRMVRLFRSPEQWRRLTANCFRCDFSWARSARNYLTWFEELGRGRPAPRT